MHHLSEIPGLWPTREVPHMCFLSETSGSELCVGDHLDWSLSLLVCVGCISVAWYFLTLPFFFQDNPWLGSLLSPIPTQGLWKSFWVRLHLGPFHAFWKKIQVCEVSYVPRTRCVCVCVRERESSLEGCDRAIICKQAPSGKDWAEDRITILCKGIDGYGGSWVGHFVYRLWAFVKCVQQHSRLLT